VPRCMRCGAVARPATQLATDGHCIVSHLHPHEKAFKNFVESIPADKLLLVLEIGCGLQMPRLREQGQTLVTQHRAHGGDAVLVRLNLHEPLIIPRHPRSYSLPLGAQDALLLMDRILDDKEGTIKAKI